MWPYLWHSAPECSGAGSRPRQASGAASTCLSEPQSPASCAVGLVQDSLLPVPGLKYRHEPEESHVQLGKRVKTSKKHSTCNKSNVNSVVAPPNHKSALFLQGLRPSALLTDASNHTLTSNEARPIPAGLQYE